LLLGGGLVLYLLAAAAEALLGHMRLCRGLGLGCADPPLFTTGYLEALGYTGYRLRQVLSAAKRAGRVDLYVSASGGFWLEPVYSVGSAYYERETRVPLDVDDCIALRDRCRVAPRTTLFYVYLVGSHGGEQVRLNVVYLATMADRATGGAAEEALARVAACLRGGGPPSPGAMEETRELFMRVVGLATRVLPMVLPGAPEEPEGLLERSPGLRRLREILTRLCGSGEKR
jgi:hypothetical protein